MASRVNVKFVVILSVSLVTLVLGVGGVFIFVKMRSGDRLYTRGQEAMARGDYKAADLYLSKAVNKKRTNLEYINAWRKAREGKVPESQTVFEDEYAVYVYGILRQLAIVQNDNVEAHAEYLEAIYQQRVNLGSNREAWLHLAKEADDALKYFPGEAPVKIRRYRGLALSAMVVGGMDLPAERAELAKEDLHAVVEADPKDTRAALELIALHAVLSGRAQSSPEVAAKEEKAATDVLERTLAANPDDFSVLLTKLIFDAAKVSQKFDGMNSAEARRARAQAMEEFKPRVGELADRFQGDAIKGLDASAVYRFLSIAMGIDPENGLKLASELARRALEADPNDVDLLMTSAQLSTFAGEFDRAMEIYERIDKLPAMPVGLEGLKLFSYRRAALVGRTDVAISKAFTTEERAAREEALKRAEQIRTELSQRLPEQSADVAFLDGKLLFLKGDLRGAQRKLDPLLKGNTLPPMKLNEAVAIMADIGMRLDPPQPGLTREYLKRALQLQPGRVDIRLNLANVEMMLGEDKQAAELLRQVLELDPEHERAKTQLAIIQARQNEGTVEDPVLATLVQVDRMLTGERRVLIDEAGAVKLLRDSLERLNYDQRIVTRLVSLLIYQNERDEALAVLAAAIERQPENENYKALERQVKAAGSLEGAIALVDSNKDLQPLERHLALHRIYTAYGEPEKAASAVADAARIAPEEPRVLELQFLDALGRSDLQTASRLTDIAVRTDADRTEGDTFRARLLLAQNNPREAATLLQRSTERGNANAAIYRLLGATYLRMNRGPEAVASLKRALELNPTDAGVLKTLLTAMVQLGNTQDALATARAADAVVRRNADLRNMWLSLESMSGNTPLVIEMREQILSRYPEDRNNAAALAEVYIAERKWDRSRELIDRLRKEEDSLPLLSLDAGWHGAQGNVLAGGRLFIDHIAALEKEPGKLTAEPFVAMAQFMHRNGQIELALEALRNGSKFQDQKTRPLDLMAAEINLRSGRYAEAEQLLRGMLEGGVEDPDLRLRKRLIDSMVQQGKSEEVTREFAALGVKIDADAELMCLQAEHLRSRGDARAAREVLDRAVARHPQDQLPYYRRARLLMTDPRMYGDAMEDLGSAVRLRPGNPAALRTRGYLYLSTGRTSEALADFRAAVEANPGMEHLWSDLLRLMVQLDSTIEAAQMAERALDARPSDLRFAQFLANTFAERKAWDAATRFYKRIWEQQRNETAAAQYIAALLEQTSPRLNEIESVLSSPALDVPKSAHLLMQRAHLRKLQRKPETARVDALSALELSTSSPQHIITWGEQLQRLYPEPGAAAQFIAGISNPPAALVPWLNITRASVLLGTESTRDSGVELLNSLARNGNDPVVRTVAVRLLSGHLAMREAWQEALEVTRVGLALAEDDVMLLNNAAYFLAQMGKGAEAVPLAERASAAAPKQPAVMDTLATAYWAAGEKAKALEHLEAAVRFPGSDMERLSLRLKLGKWRLENGEREVATRILTEVREILLESPALAEALQKPVDELSKKLGAS